MGDILFPNDRSSVECRGEIEEEKAKEMETEQWVKGGKHFSDIDWSSDEEVEYSTTTGLKKNNNETESGCTNGKNAKCTYIDVETLDKEELEIETNRADCGGQTTVLRRVISAIFR